MTGFAFGTRRVLVVLLAMTALGACGSTETTRPGLPTEGGTGSAAAAELDIRVVAAEGAEPRGMTLTCDPVGGDHPNAEAACAKLAEGGAGIFDAVPADQACTLIFGGPQTATITGTYKDASVDASFNRANGCEIDRWDTLGTEVFDVPLQ